MMRGIQWTLMAAFWVCGWSQLAAQQAGLVPVNPQARTDKLGNEWYVEQNGLISRQNSGNSILSSCMQLMVGSENFYCNQPMGTPDGKEMVLLGQQPMQGLQVSRYIRLLEKEGGMRYLEVFTNPTGRDVTITAEIRHNFSGQVKSVLTDAARGNNGTFEKGESGIAVVPGSTNNRGFLFTTCAPRSSNKPRIASQNQYQLSFFYSITVPAGKASSIMHTVTQTKLTLRPDAAELEKLFKPFALSRYVRDLPKGMPVSLVNLRAASAGATDMASWFPDEILGIKREPVDVLAMGEGTRLRGRATCASLKLQHRLGQVTVPWNQVAALTGGRFEGRESRLYLTDGQVLRGTLEAEELKFALSSGLQIGLKVAELDRLVLASSGAAAEWPQGVTALVELWNGERLAMRENRDTTLALSTAWGLRQAALTDIGSLAPSLEDGAPPLISFKDGSRLRVWMGAQGQLTFTSAQFGKQSVPGVQIRSLVVAPTLGAAPTEANETDEGDPATSFADLAGEQRLVATPGDPAWNVITSGGVVALDPSSIKELRNVSEDVPQSGTDDAAWFQMDLWGGGTVMGQLRESVLSFKMGTVNWRIPAREVLRIVNPVPKISDSALARIGQLIRELGHDDWKIREKATGELATFGEMARTSLQEAFKQNEDPEVKRRIEGILGELE
ncbi:MAG TPA: hypothetical protein VK956_12290 [Verrucomicrobium sp.]|nr:hypothetical protein [Verrucomicrobium sp.]